MDATQIILVGGGALLAGAMNAMAGGGTFFSFPALLAAGLPPVMANASNSVAMWPASLSSAWAYRREVSRHPRWTLMLVLISFIGGIAGSNAAFSRLVPWLLLSATALFAFSGQVSRMVAATRARIGIKKKESGTPGGVGGLIFQLCVAIYGGFFGAGMGILTLAALAIQGVEDIQELNGLKNLTSAVNYTVAAATFIIAGAISWPHTLLMIATAMAGAQSFSSPLS